MALKEEAQEKRKGNFERISNLASDAQSAYQTAKTAKKVASGARQGISTAVKTVRTISAAVQGIGAAIETAPAWVPAAAIVLVVLLVILVIICVIVILFGPAAPPRCESITSSSPVASYSSPVTITAKNCSEGAAFSWTDTSNGNFNPNNASTTTYTPPNMKGTTTITLQVCKPSSDSCTSSQIQITVIPGAGVTPLPLDQVAGYFEFNYTPGTTYNGVYASGEHPTDAEKNYIYQLYAPLLGSEKYRTLLSRNGKVHLYFFTPLAPGKISGHGNYFGNGSIAFFGFFEGRYEIGKKYMIAHETSHVIDRINGSNELGMDLRTLQGQDGSSCYDLGILQGGLAYMLSYPLRYASDINPRSEDFAEATANYYLCAPGDVCNNSHGTYSQNIYDFPKSCSDTASFMRTSLFGGVDFFAPPPSATLNAPSPSYHEVEFEALVKGQGRVINTFTSANDFANTIVQRYSSLAGKESYLRSIYNNAIVQSINPTVILSIWGVENSFRLGSIYEFGAISCSKGFDPQLACSIGIMNKWMKAFESNQTGGGLEIQSTFVPLCYYTDPLPYAYEWYTPICHHDDGNGPRDNFMNFYKAFLGL